jgi:hypothetical protein
MAVKMRRASLRILDQFDIARRDAQVALGQHHVQVRQQGAEERPLAVHAAQQGQALRRGSPCGQEGRDGRAEAAPARQRHPALAPAEAPGDGAQVLDRACGLADAGREPMFSSAISRIGVAAKK